jgi:hypothetical protein
LLHELMQLTTNKCENCNCKKNYLLFLRNFTLIRYNLYKK